MKTICIYHSRDLDGWMSAAIVMKWFLEQEKIKTPNNEKLAKESPHDYIKQENIWFLGWDHGDEIPDLSSYDQVIMADIAFPVDEMINLSKRLAAKFIWVDHHESAINDSKGKYDGNFGLRDVKFAACELTWKYFMQGIAGDPDKESSKNKMPEIVRLLGRYDCFGYKGTYEYQKVLEFQYGARNFWSNMDDCYNALISWNDNQEHTVQLAGYHIYNYLCTETKQIYKKTFPIEFKINDEFKVGAKLMPNLKTYFFLCVNQERFNPINFGIDYHKDGYDGFACFWYKDKKWYWSLYNDNGEVDCSVIAKQFKGGGHKGAAEMVVDDLKEVF